MDEMNITPFSSSRPQRLFEAVAWSESTIGLLQRNNIFNEATSSRFPQLSIQRAPHDVITPPPPPHPPSLYNNDVYSIGSRLRVPGSSGEPQPWAYLFRPYQRGRPPIPSPISRVKNEAKVTRPVTSPAGRVHVWRSTRLVRIVSNTLCVAIIFPGI